LTVVDKEVSMLMPVVLTLIVPLVVSFLLVKPGADAAEHGL
jgi:hypothetical protein